jgi:NDP-sugar pyrophosphorylase family protein
VKKELEPCLTVILPCAGEGNRLGLTTPKELFEIVPGKQLIDFSLEHIRAQGAEKVQPVVVVVIRPWKKEVAEYVKTKLPGIRVETVLFNDDYKEWPGSVYSAAAFFSQYNLVLLPDSYLCLGKGVPGTLMEMMLAALKNHKVVFGGVPSTDCSTLMNLGAMRVEHGIVTAFQDKPRQDLEKYNSFWGCYGFRQECGQALYEFLIKSVHYQPAPLEEQSFNPPGSIPLHSYLDLGTWENIRRFREYLKNRMMNDE